MELLIQRRPGYEPHALVHSWQWPSCPKDIALSLIKKNILPKQYHHLAPALVGDSIEGVSYSYTRDGLLIKFPDSMMPKKLADKIAGLDSQAEER
jgi:hypothetical protein